ncbi:hypothetical protein GCM10010279_31550 [Streptomyces mutabilis]|nr:hypothetical protein GCM10010279_31550 [Streptomyces mutabilis]
MLRPRMAELAGELADVAITWLTPAAYLRDTVVPALRAGADKAGRAVPRVVVIVPVALTGTGREATELALASNAGHMQLPHYADMLGRSGIDVDMKADPEASGKALVGGDAFLFGDADELRGKFEAFTAAGVDEIVLNVTGVAMTEGPAAALRELETLLRLVDAA